MLRFSIKITNSGLCNLLCDNERHCMYLRISFQVVVEDVNRDGEVSGVEGVRSVPALWAKLPPLRHNRMEVAQGEQNTLELVLLCAHFQRVLEGTITRGDILKKTRTLPNPHSCINRTTFASYR